MDSTINNIDQLKPKKFFSLGRHELRHVGDLSKPFFITVGCSHTKGVSLTYSNTWANNIAKLFNMEHINLGFSGSSLEYQLSLIRRAENILPKAKFILALKQKKMGSLVECCTSRKELNVNLA